MSSFPFSRLSIELALEIIKYAAAPDFSPGIINPYDTALDLCLVSHAFRRTVLPELLHTVILSHSHHAILFTDALRIQQSYRTTSHHLYIDYVKHVRRIWVDQCWEPLVPSVTHEQGYEEPASTAVLDYALLAPILLSATELAISFSSMHVLCSALQSVWFTNSCGTASLPWRTKHLTLIGDCWRWNPLVGSEEGSAFLASLQQLVLLIPSTPERIDSLPHLHTRTPSGRESFASKVPRWVSFIPWRVLSQVKRVIVPLERYRSLSIEEKRNMSANVDLLIYARPTSGESWVPIINDDLCVQGTSNRVESVAVALRAASQGSSEIGQFGEGGYGFQYDWRDIWLRG